MKCPPLVLLQSIMVFSCFGIAYAQEFEGIDRHLLKISRGGQSEIPFGAIEATVIQKFGTPDSNLPYFLEIKGIQGKELVYKDIEFLIVDNKDWHFTLITANVRLTLNGNSIKIGDPISVLANFFPNYQNFHVGVSGYSINLLYGSSFDEGFVLRIIYEPTTNKITKIYTHES